MNGDISTGLQSLPDCFTRTIDNTYELKSKKLNKKQCHLFYTSKQEAEVHLVETIRVKFFNTPDSQEKFKIQSFKIGSKDYLFYCSFPIEYKKNCLEEAGNLKLKRLANVRVITGTSPQVQKIDSMRKGTCVAEQAILVRASLNINYTIKFPLCFDKDTFFLFEPIDKDPSSYPQDHLQKRKQLLDKGVNDFVNGNI